MVYYYQYIIDSLLLPKLDATGDHFTPDVQLHTFIEMASFL